MKNYRTLSIALSMIIGTAAVPCYAHADNDYARGDVNCDGYVDARDASDVLAAYSKLSTGGASSLNTELADYNGDGLIDSSDASDILRRYAVLSTSHTSAGKAVCLSGDYEPASAVIGHEADDEFIEAQTDFALSLIKGTIADDNVCISPYSVTEALAMTANGAVGDTQAEMSSVLGMGIERLNDYLYTRRNDLTSGEKQFGTANSTWMRDTEGLVPNGGFMQKNADIYGADIFKAPFDTSTVSDINGWVSEKTADLIPAIIDNIPDEAMIYLINAALFDARWEEQYSEHSVSPGKFTAADGTEQDAEMMCSMEEHYISDRNAAGVYKYYRGRKFAFAAIVPDKGVSLDDYIAELSGKKLHSLLSETVECPVRTRLPKFSCEYDVSLNKTLMDMGMVKPFTDDADFSAMASCDSGALYIGNIRHKTFIDVNEEGTKAAAVTAVEMDTNALPVQYDKIKYVDFDRPFMYCIVDTSTNIPVFIGTVDSIN